MRDLYALSDVAVLASTLEGLPRSVLEAQSMQTPVVAYANDGVTAAIIDGITGFLVPDGEYAKITEHLMVLEEDERKRNTMGHAARFFVEENFSVQALAQRHESFYAKVMKGNSSE